jgi:hypothetical protein
MWFNKDATEVAKYYGMFLKNKGVLKSYAEESKPCKVVVTGLDGKACFNTWYTRGTMTSGHEGTNIFIECCFVKKVFTVINVQHHKI